MTNIINNIFEAGIVGAGGAGFPTYIKAKGRIETLIINGVECEPLIQVDKSIMRKYSNELIETLRFLQKQLKIEKIIIGVKNKYNDIIELLSEKCYEDDIIQVKSLPNIYPIGDEVVLIRETIGITMKKGELPIVYNIMVINVETLFNIYKKIFAKQNVTHSYVTVTGEVKNPGTYNLPIGARLDFILKDIAKPTISDYKVIVGGPMTGVIAKPNETVKKNTKAFIVLNKNHSLIRSKESVSEKHLRRIMAACSQCRMCTDMCPRNLLGHKVEPHKLMNAMANGIVDNVSVLRTALGCVNCGVCELYACHHQLSPRKMMVAVKNEYARNGIRPSPDDCISESAEREYRRVPANRLITHLGLSKYDNQLPFYDESYDVKMVEISLSQHIGSSSEPCVMVGDKIKIGDIIGKAKENVLSANIHSSISGIVKQVDQHSIKIERM